MKKKIIIFQICGENISQTELNKLKSDLINFSKKISPDYKIIIIPEHIKTIGVKEFKNLLKSAMSAIDL